MWDFLIQLEGECKWQPLKDAKNSLSEGRYRLVLHSNLKKTNIQVSISYKNLQGKSQSVKQHLGKTNERGLMMLLPYTDLQPGLWQVTCSSCPVAQANEAVWQQTMQLDILAKESKPKEIVNQYLTQLEALIKQEIEPYLEKHSAQSLVRAKLLPDLQIVLNQTSFFSLQGEVVPIFGHIEMRDTQFPYLILSDFKIRYEIQDIQTGQMLFNWEQAISIEQLPFAFQYFLELPTNLEQTTFRGEVILETVTPSINIVGSQTFTLITEQPVRELPKLTTHSEEDKILPEVDSKSILLYLVTPVSPPTEHPALPPRLTEKSKNRKEVTLPLIPRSNQGNSN